MGLQGYSSPTPHHVLFSVDPDLLAGFRFVREAMFNDDIVELAGRYNGKDEVCFAAPQAVFAEVQRRWPVLLSTEDSVLVLGTPQSLNRRPAKLVFLRDAMYQGNAYVRDAEIDMGMFMSVTAAEAHAAGDFTHDPESSLFWICKKNPSDCKAEDEHRALTEVLIDAAAMIGHVRQQSSLSVLDISVDWCHVGGPMQYLDAQKLLCGAGSVYDRLFNVLVGRRREDGTIIDKKNICYLVPKGVKA